MPTLRHLPSTPLAAKVPAVTVLFWVIKLLTTGMGEAASDWLGGVNLALAGVVGAGGLGLALAIQLRTRRYVAAAYWLAVAMVAVFGTMLADALHVGVGVPYVVSTLFWGCVVTVLFWRWRRSEGTLSIHSITTTRRELFYWSTVLATFALGTAAGDFTATELGLGFGASAVLFGVVMLLPALGWTRFEMNSVLAFWLAYVLTRPLGASIADWLGKPHSLGSGLGFGDGVVTAVASALIIVLVAAVSATRSDVQRPADDLRAPDATVRC
ncbi:hypothetical protein [uncultured Jatrophihabitans sp.]|uniref:COG4705 family protein n=1 Tax=uncultured Jatrophihabitans sp. TaxID=1610747 RepID=UPI0035CC2150